MLLNQQTEEAANEPRGRLTPHHTETHRSLDYPTLMRPVIDIRHHTDILESVSVRNETNQDRSYQECGLGNRVGVAWSFSALRQVPSPHHLLCGSAHLPWVELHSSPDPVYDPALCNLLAPPTNHSASPN